MVDTKRIKGEEKAVFVPTNADIYMNTSQYKRNRMERKHLAKTSI